jgi:hypothetical protein
MHCSRSKIPSKKSRPYIFLSLIGAPYIYIYDISRLRVNYWSPGDFSDYIHAIINMTGKQVANCMVVSVNEVVYQNTHYIQHATIS